MFPVESLIKLQNLGIWVSCQLPDDQLKPVPAWSSTCLDLFGPFETRGETNKQIRGKAYGVIFSWMLTRATQILQQTILLTPFYKSCADLWLLEVAFSITF